MHMHIYMYTRTYTHVHKLYNLDVPALLVVALVVVITNVEEDTHLDVPALLAPCPARGFISAHCLLLRLLQLHLFCLIIQFFSPALLARIAHELHNGIQVTEVRRDRRES